MDTAKILSDLVAGKIFQQAFGKTADVKFQTEVRAACEKNYCGMYGKCWVCPPGVGDLDSLAKKYAEYENFFVFTTKHAIEDSFDIEGMTAARKEHRTVEELLLPAVQKNGLALLGAGGCDLCEKCSYPDAPCRNPARAIPSMEAAGINVVELAHDTGVNYHNGENTVTYFSIVFFN